VKDLVGREMTPAERRLLRAYDAVRALLEEPDLAPAVEANVKEAAASLWIAVNDLGLRGDRPHESRA
jgi:hypothetical protein